VAVVAVIGDRDDRPSVDQDHAAVPASVPRISSTRSARSGSADSVPALSNVRTGSVANCVERVGAQPLGESVSLVTGQASLQGGAQHLADCRDPVLGQDVDQAVYFVPGGHAASAPRSATARSPPGALWNAREHPGIYR